MYAVLVTGILFRLSERGNGINNLIRSN